MKKVLLLFIFTLISQHINSQNSKGKPFITGSLNTTFGINQHYTLDPDDDEPLIVPAAFLFRVGIGYQFNNRWAASLNAGYDFHFKHDIAAFPTYASLRYNITEDANDLFFVETSYGKMWRPAVRFEDGKYYKLGVGLQIAGNGRWHTIIRLDFHRKAILDFKNGHLDSISLGVGFSFL